MAEQMPFADVELASNSVLCFIRNPSAIQG